MTIRGGAPGGRAPTGASDDLSDLLGRIARRDAAAFAALYKQTSAKLYGVVARILTRGDAAADVLQEAYVRIWEKAGDFDPVAARERSEGLAALIDCLQRLDEEKRDVVLLAYCRGLSREALAKR